MIKTGNLNSKQNCYTLLVEICTVLLLLIVIIGKMPPALVPTGKLTIDRYCFV